MPRLRWRPVPVAAVLAGVLVTLCVTPGCAAAVGSASAPAGPVPVAAATPDTGAAATPDARATGTGGTGAAARRESSGLPAHVTQPPAGSGQLVTVTARSSTSTTATLEAWQREGPGWQRVQAAVPVTVGPAGIGRASEGSSRTPAGTFPLDEAFGRAANPGTGLPYRRVDDNDWWVSDPASPMYNTHHRCAPGSCAFDEQASENLSRAGASYDYAVVIGYNVQPVRPGAGSAFFVHVDAGIPSAGCVLVQRAAMIDLLRWLDADQRPVITIAGG